MRDFRVGYCIGGFVGDTFPSFLDGAAGSYVPTFAIMLVTTVVAGFIIVRVCRRHAG